MTKFILHGGSTSTPNELNGKFFSEITKDVPEGGRVLIVYFSRKEVWPMLRDKINNI